ncbi:MAG: hypothetical protein AAF762_15300, partial [Pseudomonadota bacterium]
LPVHAAAERPVSPAEFEAIVTGKTYTYSVEGTPYGAEEYLDNRRVKWTFLDGECQDGEWYVSGEQICFVYEHIETHQCWMFFMDGNRMMARYAGDPAATTLYETAQSDEPLMCLGPKIGV